MNNLIYSLLRNSVPTSRLRFGKDLKDMDWWEPMTRFRNRECQVVLHVLTDLKNKSGEIMQENCCYKISIVEGVLSFPHSVKM